MQHVGRRDGDGRNALLRRQHDRAVAAGEVIFGIPAATEFFVTEFVASGPVGEETACLTGPREVRELGFLEPFARGRIARRNAAAPHRVNHAGQRKVIGKRAETLEPLALRIAVGRDHARHAPVGAAEDSDAARADVFIEDVHQLADGNVGIIAVHQVNVHAVGLQALERLVQLLRDAIGGAEGRVPALADHNQLIAQTAVFHPLAEQPLLQAAAIKPGGVKGVSATLKIIVPHRRGVRHRALVVAAHDKPRDR